MVIAMVVVVVIVVRLVIVFVSLFVTYLCYDPFIPRGTGGKKVLGRKEEIEEGKLL